MRLNDYESVLEKIYVSNLYIYFYFVYTAAGTQIRGSFDCRLIWRDIFLKILIPYITREQLVASQL